MLEDTKKYVTGAIKSTTIQFNALLLILIETLPLIQESLPQLKTYLPDDLYKQVFLLVVIGNILLRAKTNVALKDR